MNFATNILRMLRHAVNGAVVAGLCLATASAPASADEHEHEHKRGEGIKNILVVNLENESEGATFGPASPAKYLNDTLLKQGELIPDWYATGHVSLDNYIAQISGQGSTPSTNSDCINAATFSPTNLTGMYFDVSPGADANNSSFPGQVIGDGCIYPAPVELFATWPKKNGARTIGDQLDEKYGQVAFTTSGVKSWPGRILWRQYSEDMGNTQSRDGGTPDPLGGTDCGHPALNGVDTTNSATAFDQYATRHNGFMYFHSVIDNQARCDAHVVPLGKVNVGMGPDGADLFSGHLYQDLQRRETTPKFMFVTPNLCNDGHDATCKGPNTEGGSAGGLVGADLWLKHWMPMILASPAYKVGELLVVLTFDEGDPLTDTAACDLTNPKNSAICNYPKGPNMSNFGYSPILGFLGYEKAPTTTGVYPGGGKIGAVLFNARHIAPGSVNSVGQYNHFSALRSYEDILGIDQGGDDGHGHLGFAAQPDLRTATFGYDVFNKD